MNNEITVILRSKDAIVHDGVYMFHSVGLQSKLADINCLQMALSRLVIPREFIFKQCPPIKFAFSLTTEPNNAIVIEVPSFGYVTPDEIPREIVKFIPMEQWPNMAIAYDSTTSKFQISYNKLSSFEMDKTTEEFFQFDIGKILLNNHRKALSIDSLQKVPIYKPVHIFIECDIATSSSVGSRMIPVLDHFSYNMDDAGVFEYRPRPLNWVNCAYRPQCDTRACFHPGLYR